MTQKHGNWLLSQAFCLTVFFVKAQFIAPLLPHKEIMTLSRKIVLNSQHSLTYSSAPGLYYEHSIIIPMFTFGILRLLFALFSFNRGSKCYCIPLLLYISHRVLSHSAVKNKEKPQNNCPSQTEIQFKSQMVN